jgi:hypothetical protein
MGEQIEERERQKKRRKKLSLELRLDASDEMTFPFSEVEHVVVSPHMELELLKKLLSQYGGERKPRKERPKLKLTLEFVMELLPFRNRD